MANYTVDDVKPIFINLLEEIGAIDIKELDDSSFSKRTRNRIITACLNDKRIAVICYPIVVRTKARGREITPQHYIDINSSAWKEIKIYWKKACIEDRSCLLLGMRHEDTMIGDYIFSIEGKIDLLSGKSVYIHANQLADIKRNIGYKQYNIETEEEASLSVIKTKLFKEYLMNYENQISSSMLKDTIEDWTISFGDENISVIENTSAKEGKRLLYYTTKYERSPKNRKAAIEKHGTICFGCGFDFEANYGERGKGFIEIHHVKPLYSLDGEMKVNPEKDLVPVCSNCHRMIHKKKDEILTIKQLKKIIRDNKK